MVLGFRVCFFIGMILLCAVAIRIYRHINRKYDFFNKDFLNVSWVGISCFFAKSIWM
jgi:hypothetical protein